MEALPLEAQVSPVFGIVIEDLDHDNNVDLFLTGNFYGLEPEVGRQDANHGIVLRGDGKGKFANVSSGETGLYIRGEVRDAKVLSVSGKRSVLIARNNASVQIFGINKK